HQHNQKNKHDTHANQHEFDTLSHHSVHGTLLLVPKADSVTACESERRRRLGGHHGGLVSRYCSRGVKGNVDRLSTTRNEACEEPVGGFDQSTACRPDLSRP
ncbi:hypothetical protein, partial [Alcanivorax sp. HI0044]|uniref:hypothetical protein n=1 Tax=Alcanivorax sp. HI0044 TaxID=1822234 RepID=UPI001E3AA4FF